MNIVMIGSGNVATHLAQALSRFYHISQIYSPNLEHAQRLARQVNAEAINQLQHLQLADLYIIAVKDQAIADVATKIAPWVQHATVVHTSGSVDQSVLRNASIYNGVFYPLQTFSRQKPIDFRTVPLLLESNHPRVKAQLDEIAKKVSPLVYHYSSEQRRSLHLGAVLACNFSNYLYSVADQYLSEQGVDFNLLKPLIVETASKITHHSPVDVQTGPAVRGDHAVIERHVHMLSDHYDLQQLYQQMSDGIANLQAQKKPL